MPQLEFPSSGLALMCDVLIGVGHLAIPTAIFLFLRHRPLVEMRRAAALVAAFIVWSGVAYGLALFPAASPTLAFTVKAVAAIVSVISVALIFPLVAKAADMPSKAELAALNTQRIGTRLQGLPMPIGSWNHGCRSARRNWPRPPRKAKA